jgi:hypothetical protein
MVADHFLIAAPFNVINGQLRNVYRARQDRRVRSQRFTLIIDGVMVAVAHIYIESRSEHHPRALSRPLSPDRIDAVPAIQSQLVTPLAPTNCSLPKTVQPAFAFALKFH